jgi:thymidylate kinase
VRLFELLRYYSWIVDRFHISTIVYQAGQGRRYDFGWLEERLVPLGYGVILCTRADESFPAALRERLEISGAPGQYDDLKVFIKEQEMFTKAVSRSKLPHLVIDVSEDDVDTACEQIADWLESEGLLGYPD